MVATVAESVWQAVMHPLMVPVALSAAAGCVAYVAARWWAGLSKAVALVACAAVLALTAQIAMRQQAPLAVRYMEVFGLELWVRMADSALSGLIGLGAAFFALLVCIFGLGSLRGVRDEGRFYAFLSWALAGSLGVAFAADLIWLLVCWEFTTLALYMLLNLHRPASAGGAAKTYGVLGFSDAAMLLGIASIMILTGGRTATAGLSLQLSGPLTYAAYLLLLAAALAKAGAIPLHSWIPGAAGEANAATFALLPAAIDKLLGIYLLVRLSLEWFTTNEPMRALLMVIGAVTVLAAVIMAMMQHNLKRLLSFHAVSQVGYMVLGIGTGSVAGIVGGVFHMLNNALYKSSLFLCAGAVERRTGQAELDRLGGLARSMPGIYVGCIVAAMAISGVPPLNGFVSKWLVYQGCLETGSLLGVLCLVAAVFGSALTLASFVKVIASVFLGTKPADLAVRAAGSGEKMALASPVIILGVICIFFGVQAQWPLQRLLLPAVGAAGVPVTAIEPGVTLEVPAMGLWAPGPATALILLGLLGGLLFYVIGKVAAARVRLVRPFVGGDVFADESQLRVPGTAFYETIRHLPGLRGAIVDGQEGAFDAYNLAGRHGNTLVQLLRRQHTGVLGLYVSWVLLGVAVILFYLMAAA